tara:strand:+ start:270 stop:452 length:183 start_codon:yes stop_codon:yes gene_type:complete
MTKLDILEEELSRLEFYMRIPTVNENKKRELEVECAYKQKMIQDRIDRNNIRESYKEYRL